MFNSECSDVVIIGGGPAGTTLGTLLSRRGWSVTLFERDKHPRFHIGESLLPKNLPILKELGVLDAVDRIGILKPGADFSLPGETANYQTFYFNRALGDTPPHAYQIRRSEFDELLFRNCFESNVNALEEHEVIRVDLDDNGNHTVIVRGPDNQKFSWHCKYLIDASGRDTMLATQEKWKAPNPDHTSAAIFTHFDGVIQRSGDETGNISIYWFNGGWIWLIPLRDDVMSVGIVCKPDYLKQRKVSKDAFLNQTIQKCPGAWERIKNASQLMPARATGNFSYSSKKHLGKGFALVGDAYAFVDPVFSSGVYLAMSSACDIVPIVEYWLKGDIKSYERESKYYCDKVNRSIRTFSWFIYRFMTPGMMRLFIRPRNIFHVEQAIISMLAGDVPGAFQVRIRLMFFKLLFAFNQAISTIRPKSIRT